MRKTKKWLALSMAAVMTAMTGCSGSQSGATADASKTAETQTVTPKGTAEGKTENSAAEIAKERNDELGFELYGEDGTTRKEGRSATATNGVVASNRFEASEAGRKILEEGGNAIDAAVATGFAVGVCEPMMSGLGGGGFMTIHFAETNTDTFIDFREVAPMAATPEMWQTDTDGNVIDGENMNGGKAVGVPGEVAGLVYVLEKYGTMSLEEVMAPAIEIAENGFVVTPYTAKWLDSAYTNLAACEETAGIYFNEGLPYTLGERIKNPKLANTLRKIASEGRDGFYKGEVAEATVKAVQENGGVMTLEDLANYQVEEVEPVRGTYRGYEIISSPPPSSGGTHVLQTLNILENFDMGSMEVNSPEYVHIFAESLKMAFADRGKYMGDPKYVDVPMEGLLSKEYAKTLAEKIDMTKAQDFSYGDPYSYNTEHQDTNHFAVADKAGNMVSCTKTINGAFGTGISPEGTGYILNNEMGDFDIGAGKANSIAGGKKPLSSMSPSIVLKDGKPFMVVGSPGGQTIIPTVAEVISKVIDGGMDIEDAIISPRFVDGASMAVYGGASGFAYEDRMPQETIDALEAMGHENITKQDSWSVGNVMAIRYMEDGTLKGAADPRSDGMALGY
ncbi:gamma-glutamyltransferase [uncultured Clostridium sp.]|uniref:gamma-glutamyltransferase n=1 Tax=uncultured Clostridium sp. TaxID=59620 RepID=UPI0025E0475B|nr:gamma-glutamyltransferase [uncultured Clostridium sp.]